MNRDFKTSHLIITVLPDHVRVSANGTSIGRITKKRSLKKVGVIIEMLTELVNDEVRTN